MAMQAAARSIFAAALLGAELSPAVAAAPKHVVLIMMENHGTETIIGNTADAPFLNALIGEGAYATQRNTTASPIRACPTISR